MHNKLSVYSVYSAYLLNDSKLKSCRCLSFTLLRCMRCSMSTCICIQQPVHIVTLQIWENTIRVASHRVVDASGKIRFNFICILITSVITCISKILHFTHLLEFFIRFVERKIFDAVEM